MHLLKSSALIWLCSAAALFAQESSSLPPSPGGPPAPPSQPGAPTAPASRPAAAPAAIAVQNVVAEVPRQLSIVRVNVTNQAYDFFRPWGKRPPITRRAIGAVLPGQRVLVTAELVANANYIEFENAEGGFKTAAKVEIVDYEGNLALLRSDAPGTLFDDLKPLEFTTPKVGDMLSVWQLENNGNLLVTKGPMTTAEVGRYPIEESNLLLYKLTAPLQFRDGSFTLPVVKDEKLVGLIARYDPQSNNADIVPTPVIEHFLKDVEKGPYEGFPRAGVSFAITRDPQLRRYAGLDGKVSGGVYVTELLENGPAERAGVRKGDVIIRIGEFAVDQDGNYSDPIYGKISLSHLLSTRHFEGDKAPFTIVREGQTITLEVEMRRRRPEEYVVEPYVIDRAPNYFILGGLVLQELSRQYLKEWGSDWIRKAPEELIYLDRQQSDLFPEGGKKIIILTRVLPSDSTIGYEELHHLIVTRINDVELKSLADVEKAVAQAKDGLHKVEFNGDPAVIYLDAEKVKTSEAILARTYRLPSLHRLN